MFDSDLSYLALKLPRDLNVCYVVKSVSALLLRLCFSAWFSDHIFYETIHHRKTVSLLTSRFESYTLEQRKRYGHGIAC